MTDKTFKFPCAVVFNLLLLAALPAAAQQLGVEAAVEKQQVFMGEAFVFQIKINGSDTPREPELKGFGDFTVVSMGGTNSSSQSITIINGRMQQSVTKSFIYQYQLTPKKTGNLTIPAVLVEVEGKNLLTNAIRITVKEPSEAADYKLRLSLSKSSCYTGEPVIFSLTWYIGANAEEVSFNIPLLDDKRFIIEDIAFQKTAAARYLIFPAGNRQLEFEHPNASTTYQGKEFRTLSFRRVLIPKASGRLLLEKAFVEFNGVSGYRNVRDWFGQTQQQEVYGKFVVPSNSLSLNVREVPQAGKPYNYSGLIGTDFRMEVSASPLEVKVGDPITLRIELSGPQYLTDLKIPQLNTIKELTASFKIPADQSPGTVEGNKKVFTQTLRALGTDVTGIPRFQIGYFNTASGRYEAMSSEAIPLQVSASEIKTFLDLEGMEPVEMKSELESWSEGIAHNYEGADILRDESTSLKRAATNPVFILLLVLPVFAYFVLFYFTRFGHLLKVSEEGRKSRKAYTALNSVLTGITRDPDSQPGSIYSRLLEEINAYLGSKLKLKGSALTYRDVEDKLQSHGVGQEALAGLQQVYRTCEAGCYAGGVTSAAGIIELCGLIQKTVSGIERSFRK